MVIGPKITCTSRVWKVGRSIVSKLGTYCLSKCLNLQLLRQTDSSNNAGQEKENVLNKPFNCTSWA